MKKISKRAKIIGSISLVCCLGLTGIGYNHIQAVHRQHIHRTSHTLIRKEPNNKIRLQKKHTKKPKITTQTRNNQRDKKSLAKWHKGVPYIFHTKSLWLSNFLPANKYQRTSKIKYTRYITTLGPQNGFNTTPNMYSAQKVHMKYGVNNGPIASMHPHFQIIGHDKYILVSGSKTKNNQQNLKQETIGNRNSYGEKVIIQIKGPNEFNAWLIKSKHSHLFIGTYSRLPYNTNVALKALGMK